MRSSSGEGLNLQKGKASVVATFKGPGAPAMHAKYQLESRPGFSVQLVQEEASVHLMPCYNHLGTMFSSAHTLDQEIAMRIGVAKSAFAQVARPIQYQAFHR